MPKLTTALHKFIDFERMEMPEGLVDTLEKNRMFVYEDTFDIKEHIYSIDQIMESIEEGSIRFSIEQSTMLDRIYEYLRKRNTDYFRFVTN